MTAPKPAPAHQDDAAVDALAATMKANLAKQRAKGYSGWDTPEFTQQRLSDMLREHVDKGDPVDVANFCAFLAARGEGIAQAAPQQEPSYTAVQLAEMVLSDCGHSSNYTPLLERVAGRIDRHVERLLTAQHAARAPADSVLEDAEIDRIVPALEPVSEDFPAEWAVWKDRERIREELRAARKQGVNHD